MKMAQSQKYAVFTGWGINAFWKCKLRNDQCSRVSFNNRKPMCKGCWVETEWKKAQKKLKKAVDSESQM